MKVLILLSIAAIAAVVADPAEDQLADFKKRTEGLSGLWRTSNGAPVERGETTVLNSNILTSEVFLEELTHITCEKIPERVITTKGTGAFGYFKVTHNISDICSADIFSENGKITPVAVRFSQISQDKGEADTVRDSRGFAVKFYTEEGNLDLVGLNTPMFIFKEPMLFPTTVRAIKRNPVTNTKDLNILWDFLTSKPETVNYFLYIFGDNGIPDGYRHMPGYIIHTLQLYNKYGEVFYGRFHFKPNLGVRNLLSDEASTIACSNPDYASKDIYNAIERGEFPSWTLSIQVLTNDDVRDADFDVFDVTKELPEDKYPSRTVGQLVLDRNPTNHFADVDQIAFSATNLVPGIMGSPDKVFETRRLAYRDAQRHRLGANYNKIAVNCPRKFILGYDRDGAAPVGYNGGDAPNYYPNSFNGPRPYVDKNRPSGLIRIKEVDDSLDFEQPTDRYNGLSIEKRQRLADNIVSSLRQVEEFLQKRAIDLFNQVNSDLAYRISVGLAGNSGTGNPCD